MRTLIGCSRLSQEQVQHVLVAAGQRSAMHRPPLSEEGHAPRTLAHYHEPTVGDI